MTAILPANHHHQIAFDSRLALASLLSEEMAQPPPYLPWSNELTVGAQSASAPVSVERSPAVSPYSHSGAELSFGDRSSSSGQAGAQYVLPLRPAGATETQSSTLDRLGFTKFLSADKKTRDGQQPKRRGPKPDSKPALTRRQELNRQAQRTHRERKELYIKALEEEVLRLKELHAEVVRERDSGSRERDALVSETQRLKDLLTTHGIQYDHVRMPSSYGTRSESNFGGSVVSHAGSSYTSTSASPGFTSPQLSGGLIGNPAAPALPAVTQAMNYDQIGIDFVLALEHNCFSHLQPVMIMAQKEVVEMHGHALMASCPPPSHVAHSPEQPYPHKMPDMAMPDLVRLLHLSNRLPLDGEITPVMAWAGVTSHPRFEELDAADLEALKQDLVGKVRCYGFGAVLEEFEIRDAIAAVLAPKDLLRLPYSAGQHVSKAISEDPLAQALSSENDLVMGPSIEHSSALAGLDDQTMPIAQDQFEALAAAAALQQDAPSLNLSG